MDAKRASGDGIAALLKGTADAMGHLLAGHLKLARLELMEDAQAVGGPAALVAAFAALAILGYGLVVLGLAATLRPYLGWPGALFLLGGLHLAGGGIGARRGLRRLKAVKVLDESTQEATGSLATIRAAGTLPERAATDMEKASGREGPGRQEPGDRPGAR
jgi:hypothetical protein